MITVTKEYTFDCAHQLVGYDGQCENIHGHTYKLQVTCGGEIITDSTNPKDGMIIDFSDLKKAVTESIISKFDHAFIACGNEPTYQQMVDSGTKIFNMGCKTTCENMVNFMGTELNKTLNVTRIRLWETPTSFATWYK